MLSSILSLQEKVKNIRSNMDNKTYDITKDNQQSIKYIQSGRFGTDVLDYVSKST